MPTDQKKAKDILDGADQVLEKLDGSYIFKHSRERQFPHFQIKEIGFGEKLGAGGFSVVNEIDRIHLIDNGEAIESPLPDDADDDADNHDMITNESHKDHIDHYDVSTAREFMSKHYLRGGSARYAVKRLKNDLSVVDRARGAVDLAIEIKFLKTIWHPNIIKMRGYSTTSRVDKSTFLILDRLYGTLNEKIEGWEVMRAAHRGCCGMTNKKHPVVIELLKERLLAAYDLSSAINYLHGMRDIKPENIGFDIRGDLRLFDFGLMKSLEDSNKVKDGHGYQLTAKTGSIPYMSPEIALGKPYGLEADVYSFSVLLWEIVGLEWAFNGYSAAEYFYQVCAGNNRLPIQRSWPAMVKMIIAEGWDKDPQKRPSMERVGNLLLAELEDLTDDTDIRNRTQQLMNKSTRSRRGKMAGSTGKGANLTGSRGRRQSLEMRSEREIFVGEDQCCPGQKEC